MPRLFAKSLPEALSYELRLGINRIGRGEDNHLQIREPSVSSSHCELLLGPETMIITDLGSSNGTFIDGVLVREGFLFPGQTLRLGQIELFVEAPLQVTRSTLTPWHRMNAGRERTGGDCARHPAAEAVYFCPNCNQPLCQDCVQALRQGNGLRIQACRKCAAQCHVYTAPRPTSPAVAAAVAMPGVMPPEPACAESFRQRLLPHLAAWLKQKFVQVLLQQRDGLIATQEAATEQMRAFEGRLARVQSQMEARIHSYEERIRELEADLSAAAQENKSLIRARLEAAQRDFEDESKLLITE